MTKSQSLGQPTPLPNQRTGQNHPIGSSKTETAEETDPPISATPTAGPEVEDPSAPAQTQEQQAALARQAAIRQTARRYNLLAQQRRRRLKKKRASFWWKFKENNHVRRGFTMACLILGVMAPGYMAAQLWDPRFLPLAAASLCLLCAIIVPWLSHRTRYYGVTLTGSFTRAAKKLNTEKPFQLYCLWADDPDPDRRALYRQDIKSERRVFRDNDNNRWWQNYLAFRRYRKTEMVWLLVDQRDKDHPRPRSGFRCIGGSSEGLPTTNALKHWEGQERNLSADLLAAGIDPNEPRTARAIDMSMIWVLPYEDPNDGLPPGLAPDIPLYAGFIQYCLWAHVRRMYAIMNHLSRRRIGQLGGDALHPIPGYGESNYDGSTLSLALEGDPEQWGIDLKTISDAQKAMAMAEGRTEPVTMYDYIVGGALDQYITMPQWGVAERSITPPQVLPEAA